MKAWRWDPRSPGTEPLICVVHMCNSYHLSLSTLVIKVSHIAHFINCLVTSVTRPPPPPPSLTPSRFVCLRTQQTAGRFVLTADVWRSPFFYFTSVTVFLCWHFRLIWFGRLIIAALWTVHHSVRPASQQTCSFLFPHKFPWFFLWLLLFLFVFYDFWVVFCTEHFCNVVMSHM